MQNLAGSHEFQTHVFELTIELRVNGLAAIFVSIFADEADEAIPDLVAIVSQNFCQRKINLLEERGLLRKACL
jgi:hypothetical protein